ncbi:MAG: hypothetical protein ACQEWV_17975 [Bacillota bacterium]
MEIIFIIFFLLFILLIILKKFKQKEKAIQVYTVQDFIHLSNHGFFHNPKEESTVFEEINDYFDGNKGDVEGFQDHDDIDEGGDE